MRKFIIIISLAFLFCFVILSWNVCSAVEFEVFSDEYLRETGTPEVVTNHFIISNFNDEYFLRVYNGGLEDNEAELVSSSSICINGIEVVGSNNFNQHVSSLEIPLDSQLTIGDNTISVEVKGKPGGILLAKITGYMASCEPKRCGTYTFDCSPGFACACFEIFEGGGLCIQGLELCTNLIDCPNGTVDCPEGYACTVKSCCGVPKCIKIERTVLQP